MSTTPIPILTTPWLNPGEGDVHPAAEEVSFAALRMTGADWWHVDALSDVTEQVSRFASLAEVASVPGRVAVFVDLAANQPGSPLLAVHLVVGVFGEDGSTEAEARQLARVARTTIEAPPTVFGLEFTDPQRLFEVSDSDTAVIAQSMIRVGDDQGMATAVSRFDHSTDPWVRTVEALVGQGHPVRLRTTLLATELSVGDQLTINEQLQEAEAIAARSDDHSTVSVRVRRVAATLRDVAESFATPVFAMEVALTSPAPMSELFLRAVASSITDERDVDRTLHHPGRADPLVSSKQRLVGGFEIERPGPVLTEAMRRGVPLHGGLRDHRLQDLASLTEVAFAFHWPVPAGAPLPGLPTHAARGLPMYEPVDAGPVIGRDAAGDVARIADDRGHVHCPGVTGTGKTTTFVRLLEDDVAHGRQFVVIDPHSHLASRVIELSSRAGVVLQTIDPDDPATGRLIVLEGVDAKGVTDGEALDRSVSRIIDAVTSHLPTDYSGPVFRQLSRAALTVLAHASPPRPLGDLSMLLADQDFAREVLDDNSAPEWARTQVESALTATNRGDLVGYVASKYLEFTTGGLERVLGGPELPGFSLRDFLTSGRSLVVNADKGRLGALGAAFLGHYVLAATIDAVLRRPPGERRPLDLYVDEIHAFPAVNLERGLAEGRKFGLRIAAAHQHLSQLPPGLQDSLLGNATTRVVFRTTPEDASRLGPLIDVPPADIARQPNLHAYVHHAGRHPYSVEMEPLVTIESGAPCTTLDVVMGGVEGA